MRQQTHASQRVSAAPALSVAATSAVLPATAATPAPEPVSSFNAKEFEFDAASTPTETNAASETDQNTAGAAAATIATAKATRPASAALAKKSKTNRLVAPTGPLQASSASAPSNSILQASAPTDELPLSGHKDISSALVALQPAAPAGNKSETAVPLPAASASYLEVGSFNDASWADAAVSQLSQLGFHALCVHKTHLWVQSYHVEVGPFKSPDELESAEKQLTAKGFKSHPVK
jgi:cell division protein FtsN